MKTRAAIWSAAFGADQRGSVAVIFGLMFIVLFFIAGIAVDFGRVMQTKTAYAAAVDAAALAGGRALTDGTMSDDDVRLQVQRFLDANLGDGADFAGGRAVPVVDIDRDAGSVTVTVRPSIDMTLSAVLGFGSLEIPVTASTLNGQRDIELGMQLDLTGSMCNDRGCTKLVALKDATASLVDTLLPDDGTPNKVRIAFAPFASGVNLGSYADRVTGGRHGSRTCAYDRSGSEAETDATPGAGRYFKGHADLPSAGDCPKNSIVTLTSDKDDLLDAVRKFKTYTTTAGQVGTNWAWNLIAPGWGDIWGSDSAPAEYRDGKTIKAVLLMTDGEYNTFEGQCDRSGCDPYGVRGRKSNENAKAMCANMKAEGVVVYTVGFKIDHDAAIDTLGTCATSPDHYFKAEDADQLKDAFRSIALQLSNLRLTN